jgi:putative ABC transport system permease protein
VIKSLVPYLVKKYIRFDKSQPFISISAILAFLGVSIGLMVLIVAMAIMNGTSKEFEEKISTMSYPITVLSSSNKYISKNFLKALQQRFPNYIMSPYLNTQAIIKQNGRMSGVIVFGVDFKSEAKINSIIKKSIEKYPTPEKFEAIIGANIFENYALENGKKVTVIFTEASPGGFSLMPTMKRFKINGTFKSGLQAYDSAYLYTTLEGLSKIVKVKENHYHGIHISSPNPVEDIKKIRAVLPMGYTAVGWWQQNGNLFSAMAMEKKALFIVLMLIILVASLNIISSLLMTVMNRRKEIALLLALGATKDEIKKAFFYLGSLIGGAGVVMGAILGLLGIYLLGHFDIVTLPADVYGTSKLPLELSTIDFIATIVGAVLIVLFSSYYPSKKATEVDILTTLRNE